MGHDRPVEVGPDEVQPGRGSPVAQQPRLDVLGPQRLGEQRVVEQVAAAVLRDQRYLDAAQYAEEGLMHL